MPSESTLTQVQKESIEIEKFIFHIIVVDNEEPTYLDTVELSDAQKIFFKIRISEVAEGTQYNFVDKEHNTLSTLCSNLLETEQLFIDKSKTICNDFKSHHRSSMTDGAFIIATFSMLYIDDSRIQLIALLKMDQKKVLEYELEDTDEGRIAKMREIADSFIESKDAVQKVAIIDISNTFAWDILAKERKKAEGIAEYFKSFLNAQMRDTSSSLTKKAVSEVTKWTKLNVASVKEVSEFKDKSDLASYFKSRAINFMHANEGVSFNSDNFINHLFSAEGLDESSSKVNEIKQNLKAHLTTTGIYGQVFLPKPNSIPKKISRTKKKTQEGVLIEWQGTPEDNGITIRTLANQRQEVTIITSVLEDLD